MEDLPQPPPDKNWFSRHMLLGYGFLILIFAGAVWAGYELKYGGKRNQESGIKNQGEICIQVIQRARNPQTGEVKDFPTPCDVPEGWEKITEINETANWQTYRNEEYGFEFRYPANFGEVKLDLYDGQRGKALRGIFRLNDSLVFGGNTSDYDAGREASLVDTSGFVEVDGKFYNKFGYDMPDAIRKINKDCILVGKGMYGDVTLYDYGAICNLQSIIFPGIAFENRDQTIIDQTEFEKIISTFKSTPPIPAELKAYANTKYSYQLQYPTNWVVEDKDKAVFIHDPGGGEALGINIVIRSESASEVVKGILSGIEPEPFGKLISNKEITIAGIAAREIVYQTAIGINFKDVIFEKNEDTFWIKSQDYEIIDQILSTFKFIE